MPERDTDRAESHRFFPSGDWEGFYLYRNDGEKHAMNFSLDFSNGRITGSGSDDVGGFSWKGTYNTEACTCSMTKQYSTHTIAYQGHADENGIWGNWTYGDDDTLNQFNEVTRQKIIQVFANKMNGGFHIWPRKNEQVQEAIETGEKVEKKPIHTILQADTCGAY